MGTTLKGVRLPVRIRFVGGCWDNRLPMMNVLAPVVSSADGVHVYHLAEFYTPAFHTVYYQYVHENLICNGKISLDTCEERFPYWSPDLGQVRGKGIRKTRQAFRQN